MNVGGGGFLDNKFRRPEKSNQHPQDSFDDVRKPPNMKQMAIKRCKPHPLLLQKVIVKRTNRFSAPISRLPAQHDPRAIDSLVDHVCAKAPSLVPGLPRLDPMKFGGYGMMMVFFERKGEGRRGRRRFRHQCKR